LAEFQLCANVGVLHTSSQVACARGRRTSCRLARIVEQTVLFVLMDTTGTDSIARCRSTRSEWTVCARGARTTTLRLNEWGRGRGRL